MFIINKHGNSIFEFQRQQQQQQRQQQLVTQIQVYMVLKRHFKYDYFLFKNNKENEGDYYKMLKAYNMNILN